MKSDVFECQSPTDFLQLALRHNRKKPISIRELSRKLKYSSDRAFGMALHGQRALSTEMLDRLCGYMKLTAKEETYVRLLAKRERFVRASERDSALQIDIELQQIRGSSKGYEKITDAMVQQLESWFHFPLVRLFRSKKKTLSIRDVINAFEFRIEKATLLSAIANLQSLGLIRQVSPAEFEAVGEDRYLLSSVDVPSMTIRRGHKSQLKRAIQAIDEQSVHEREFISKTLVIPNDRVEQSKKRIRETLEQLSQDLLADGDTETAASIYQLSVQFYRQARV